MTPRDGVDVTPLNTPRDGLPPVTHDDIEEAVSKLAAGHGPIAVDTERAMGIRYSNRAYLIQLRRAGAGTFLIDPIGIEDRLEGLAKVMECEWILHAADQDLPCLHELGLYPTKVFDTEIAALLLGFEKVSLQAITAEVLGIGLAKEYSNSDWSARPLAPELLTYAALDVELLDELKNELVIMLKDAGRLEWCEQECEEVRLRKPKPPKAQPWRKISHQIGIKDRRALGMLRELWIARDKLARRRDVGMQGVLPSKVLGELAARKPRSRADVVNSTLLRSRERQRDVNTWWHAIERAWKLDESSLPERRFSEAKDPFPPIKHWASHDQDAADRWEKVRGSVLTHADELGIRQDLLLKPSLQKLIAWEGWTDQQDFAAKLESWGARPWQIDQVRRAVFGR